MTRNPRVDSRLTTRASSLDQKILRDHQNPSRGSYKCVASLQNIRLACWLRRHDLQRVGPEGHQQADIRCSWPPAKRMHDLMVSSKQCDDVQLQHCYQVEDAACLCRQAKSRSAHHRRARYKCPKSGMACDVSRREADCRRTPVGFRARCCPAAARCHARREGCTQRTRSSRMAPTGHRACASIQAYDSVVNFGRKSDAASRRFDEYPTTRLSPCSAMRAGDHTETSQLLPLAGDYAPPGRLHCQAFPILPAHFPRKITLATQ